MVGQQADAVDAAHLGDERSLARLRLQIPQVDGAVLARRNEMRVVVKEANRSDRACVLLEVDDHLPRASLPHPHLALLTAGDEELAVVAALDGDASPTVAVVDGPQLLAILGIVGADLA